MTSKLDEKQERSVPRNDESISQLMWSMADTTWRMFTPPALLVPGGLWADLKFQTKPWLTLLSAVIGLGIAVLLVKRQLGGGR